MACSPENFLYSALDSDPILGGGGNSSWRGKSQCAPPPPLCMQPCPEYGVVHCNYSHIQSSLQIFSKVSFVNGGVMTLTALQYKEHSPKVQTSTVHLRCRGRVMFNTVAGLFWSLCHFYTPIYIIHTWCAGHLGRTLAGYTHCCVKNPVWAF